MKKNYICIKCNNTFAKWSGKCCYCNQWNTIEEDYKSDNSVKSSIQFSTLDNLENYEQELRISTNIKELDRVLGNGIVKSSTILIGGSPGIGKSTLLIQLISAICNSDFTGLYITGEESISQIKLRASRLDINNNNVKIISANLLEDIIDLFDTDQNGCNIVIIDSIQTIYTKTLSSAPGTVSQIKACTSILLSSAKKHNLILLISCHVNKDGQLAGPKLLEHMVDVVLYFEGDQGHYRILRAIKNRFGSVNEIGIFEMLNNGLHDVQSASRLFLLNRENNNISGTSIFVTIEGSRPILIEIQALVMSASYMVTPRRSVVGWDSNRLAMIIAVLNIRFGLNLSSYEVYLNVIGGLKVTDPAADLAVAAALISAMKNIPINSNNIFFGEIGLSGEVIKVIGSDLRIKESINQGFSQIICAKYDKCLYKDLIKPISHISELKNLL